MILSVCAIIALIAMTDAQAQVLIDGAPSVLKEDKAQSSYVYDLKNLIKKSRENIRNVNGKIKEQAVIKRNQQREDKAREYYEQAQKLTEEGRLEEARQLYDKAIRITEHPEMQYYIKDSVARTKAQTSALKKEEAEAERRLTEEEKSGLERVEGTYQAGVSLYKQLKFREAKTEFESVEEIYPGYKAVRSYLQIIEQDIVQSDQTAMKEQKKEIERQQKDLSIASLREKEQWRKEIEKKEQARVEQLKKQAEGVYAEAMQLYQERKYAASKEKFQEVEWVVPDYKATRGYLTRIDRDIDAERLRGSSVREQELEKQRWQETLETRKQEEIRKKALSLREKERLGQLADEAEFVYVAAVALFEKNLLAQAKEKFTEVEGIYPEYKSTRSYLGKIELTLVGEKERVEALKRNSEEQKIWEEEMNRKKAEKEAFQVRVEEADSFYNEASALYKTGRLIEAKEKFLQVDARVPDYKSTRALLKRIDEDIELLVKTRRHQGVLADQRAEIERLKEQKAQADKLYAEALVAYDAKEYEMARAKFESVEKIFVDYKKTKFYLYRIDEDAAQWEAKRLQEEKEKAAGALYTEGVALYNSEQFDEAKKKFIEVQVSIPNFKMISDYLDKIDDDIIRKKEKELVRLRELQAEGPYNQAITLYQQGDFQTAKQKFLEVTAVFPEYKETGKYIARIDDDIVRQKEEIAARQRAESAEAGYLQALSLYQSGDLVSAKEKFVKVEVGSPDYKDTGRYLSRIDGEISLKKQKDEQARRALEADPLYLQALSLYKEQEFYEAKKKFMQTQAVYPNYKNTAIYLSRIDTDMAKREERITREEKIRQADVLYTQAMTFYAERKFVEAKEKLLQTTAVDPAYKNTRSYLSRIDKDIMDETVRLNKAKLEAEVEIPYAEAVDLYHDRLFEEAKSKFIEVSKIIADHKKTRVYLSRIDQDIRNLKREQEKERLKKAEALYQEASAFAQQNNDALAFETFSILEGIYPDYKAVRKNIAGLREKLVKAGVNVDVIVARSSVKAQPALAAKITDTAALSLYKEAVTLYKDKKYHDAELKFQQIEKISANYRSTRKYLAEIKTALEPVAPGVSAMPIITQVAPKRVVTPAAVLDQKVVTKPTQGDIPLSQNNISNAEVLVARAEPLYMEAVALYKEGKPAEAKQKFEAVSVVIKNYKSVNTYLKMINEVQGKPNVPAVVTSVTTASSVDHDAAAVRELTLRSAAIYSQIKTLSEDRDLASSERTFARVDKILANIEAEQKRMAADIERRQKAEQLEAERQMRRQQADEKAKKTQIVVAAQQARQEAIDKKQQEEREIKLKAEEAARASGLKLDTMYQEAMNTYRLKDYTKAHAQFTEINKIKPDYKDVFVMLMHSEREDSQAKLVEAENKDRVELARLADEANAINMQILTLSQQRKYEEIKLKFSDIEGLLQQIKSLKASMMSRRDEWTARWNGRASLQQDKKNQALMARTKALTPDTDGRTAKAQARMLFREGQQLYSHHDFAEAKVKFMEAAKMDPNLKAAITYVARINRLLDQRDFENQKVHNKDIRRRLERKKESKEGLTAALSADQRLSIQERSRKLLEDGRALYRDKRYRETRIKFEELAQIGDSRQQKQAIRYLKLAENGIEFERQKAEKEKRLEEERYLRERLTQLRLEQAQSGSSRALPGSLATATEESSGFEIKRKQDLREIEQANRAERQRMLADKAELLDVADKKEDKERAKFDKLAREEKMPKEGQVLLPKKTAVMAEPVAASVVIEEKPVPEPKTVVLKKAVVRSALPAVDLEKFRQEKNKLDRQDRILKQKDAELRKALYRDQDKAISRLKAKERSLKKEQAVTVIEKKKDVPVVIEASVQKRDQKAAVVAIDKTLDSVAKNNTALLVESAAGEKRMLAQQRAAIRKDFETGVERLYNGAVVLYQQRQYEEAGQDLLAVDKMIKDYKKTGYYLNKISKRLPRKKETLLSVPTYNEKGSVKDTSPVVSKPAESLKAVMAVPALHDERSRTVNSVLDLFDPNADK